MAGMENMTLVSSSLVRGDAYELLWHASSSIFRSLPLGRDAAHSHDPGATALRSPRIDGHPLLSHDIVTQALVYNIPPFDALEYGGGHRIVACRRAFRNFEVVPQVVRQGTTKPAYLVIAEFGQLRDRSHMPLAKRLYALSLAFADGFITNFNRAARRDAVRSGGRVLSCAKRYWARDPSLSCVPLLV
jgi:hypothetical protein